MSSSAAQLDPQSSTLDSGDADYTSRTGQSEVPVQSDSAPVEDPIDPATADSDETLQQDEQAAMDESNIVDSRTRGAKPSGSYVEPGDDEGLPSDDGTSST
ncbi:hypothetical protein B0A49_00847 [Cryomyces minteri]|uniref:Histone chaperone domain-containing protein n=1 Tax=Cryomyces minteri TaxID=331657 RepID=A0A4U0XXV9_9PEZI|nr:hypothetical protein B0A49_00847 [Cryomyces minteri]